MHYPWWYVPQLTSPMVIAAIATIHVLVAHYAVGGGLFLAVETGYAYRTGNRDYLAYSASPYPFLRPLDRRLWRHHRSRHLVDDRPGIASGNRSADPHVRFRLGNGVRVLPPRDSLGLRVLLLLGSAGRKDARCHGLAVRLLGLDEPGARSPESPPLCSIPARGPIPRVPGTTTSGQGSSIRSSCRRSSRAPAGRFCSPRSTCTSTARSPPRITASMT